MRIFGLNIHLPWERRKRRVRRRPVRRHHVRRAIARRHLAVRRRRRRKVGFFGGIIRTVRGFARTALNFFKPPQVRVMERLMKRHVALAKRLKRRPRIRRIRHIRPRLYRRRLHIRHRPRPVLLHSRLRAKRIMPIRRRIRLVSSRPEIAPAPARRYVTVERRKLPSGGWVARVAPVMPMQRAMKQMPMQQPVKQPAQLAVRSEGGKSGGESNNLLPLLAVAGGIAALMLMKKK